MKNFCGTGERKWLDAVIVRTDYSDETAWQALRAAVEIGNTSTAFDARNNTNWPLLYVEDAVWAGATLDDVRDVANRDECLSVVFIADRSALADPEHKLLAVASGIEWNDERRETEFRVVPGWVMLLHGTLAATDVRFRTFAESAAQDPDGVFRGFVD